MPETVLADTPAPKAEKARAKGAALLGGRIPLARLRDLALVPAIVVIAIVGQIVNRSSSRATTSSTSCRPCPRSPCWSSPRR